MPAGRTRRVSPEVEAGDHPDRRSDTRRIWPTIIPLALSASPGAALRGLGWIVRGKRVRGWNLIYHAASLHPAYYRHWMATAEGRVIRRFGTKHRPVVRSLAVGCLILGFDEGEARETLHNVRESLGPTIPIWTNVAALSVDGAMPLSADVSIAESFAKASPQIDWLLPLRAGDMLSPALGGVLARVVPDPCTNAVVYWDEDRIRGGRREDPWLKPDWDPMLFGDGAGVMGAGLIATTALCDAAREGECMFDPAGIANVVKRVLAAADLAPVHLPLILTHRRAAGSAVALATASGRDVSLSGAVPAAPPVWPEVSIIIPMRDKADLLRSCMAGLRTLTYPGRVAITIVDNDSAEAETHALLTQLMLEDAVGVLPYPGDFNFAAMVNHAAGITRGEVLCLLNNDIEPCDGAWLEAMVRYAVCEKIGAVGARLLYPDGTIQHAGVAIGIGGAAGHVQKGVDPEDPRFFQWHSRSRTVSAVTAACMVLERSKFQAAGGMDAVAFPVDFNDVDLCLKLMAAGLRNVLAVEATLVHHESQSRGTSRSPASAARFSCELATLRARWHTLTWHDPYHSPRFRREAEQCILAF